MALIKCPKCGKQFSEHTSECPVCGLKKEEWKLFLAEQKRIRGERKKEQWHKHKKNLYIGFGIVLLLIVPFTLRRVINGYNYQKEKDARALIEIQIGDSLFNESQYAGAIRHYHYAINYASHEGIYKKCVAHYDSVQSIITHSIPSFIQGCWIQDWGHDGYYYVYFNGNNRCKCNYEENWCDYEVKDGKIIISYSNDKTETFYVNIKDSVIYSEEDKGVWYKYGDDIGNLAPL